MDIFWIYKSFKLIAFLCEKDVYFLITTKIQMKLQHLFYYSTLKMERVITYETLVQIQKTTLRHTSEDRNLMHECTV
jgi:hypothetical protein